MDDCLIEMFTSLIQIKRAAEKYIERWISYYPNLTREYLDEEEFALLKALERFQNWSALKGEPK